MLPYFFLLCLLQLIGEAIVYLGDLPIPGPVVGMALLLFSLLIKKGLQEGLDQAAGAILRYLALLFIPAGVGISLHFNLISREWLPISAAVFFGTLITIAFSGLLMKWMGQRNG